MKLSQALEIHRGVTAVIGGGGKTSLLRALGEELAGETRTVLLCTTTKIRPFPGLVNLSSPSEAELRRALRDSRLIAAGTPVPGTDKWGAPELPMNCLAALADYVLVEADGSAGRPMKAHAPHEPVIPAQASQTVLVVGASGFGPYHSGGPPVGALRKTGRCPPGRTCQPGAGGRGSAGGGPAR